MVHTQTSLSGDGECRRSRRHHRNLEVLRKLGGHEAIERFADCRCFLLRSFVEPRR